MVWESSQGAFFVKAAPWTPEKAVLILLHSIHLPGRNTHLKKNFQKDLTFVLMVW